MKGAPIRLEIGPRDVTADQATIVRLDTREKQAVSIATLAPAVESLLGEIQVDLFSAARRMLDERTAEVESFEELATRVAANAGWSLVHWCGGAACEAQVKAETKATIRCIPRNIPPETGRCILCGGISDRRVIVARAY